LDPQVPDPPQRDPLSLAASVDPDDLSGSQLEAELSRIRSWLNHHPVSSEDRARMDGEYARLRGAYDARAGRAV
jgi:hypothetical protein